MSDNAGMTYTTHRKDGGGWYVLEWRDEPWPSTNEQWRVVAGPYTSKADAQTWIDDAQGVSA